MMLTDYMRHEKKEEEGLVALKNDFDASIQRIEDYIEKCRERLITANRNNAESMRINRTKITKKNKYRKENNYMGISSDK